MNCRSSEPIRELDLLMRNQTTGQILRFLGMAVEAGSLIGMLSVMKGRHIEFWGEGPLRPEPAAGHDLHPRPDHLDHRPANDSSEPITGGRVDIRRPVHRFGFIASARSSPRRARGFEDTRSAVASRPRRPARRFSIHAKVARFPRRSGVLFLVLGVENVGM